MLSTFDYNPPLHHRFQRKAWIMSQHLVGCMRSILPITVARRSIQTAMHPIVLKVIFCLFLGIVFAGGSRSANAQVAQVAGPNDDTMVNNFVPQGICGPAALYTCDYYIQDTKTGWLSGLVGRFNKLRNGFEPGYPLTSATPIYCYYWWSNCQFQPDYVSIATALQQPLMKPSVDNLSQGITFLLKIRTVPRSSDSQQSNAFTMPGVFSAKTLGPRWALHTYQLSPQGGGDGEGYDEGPWEPIIYDGNVNMYEDVYYTFTSDGRVRIDKFTPYTTGFIWTDTHYIWDESINDGGWPIDWANGPQGFLAIQELILGGTNGALDDFRGLSVFKKALSRDEMINQENFSHDSHGNLATGMVPCNTGNWANAENAVTPCGTGGDGSPVPEPRTHVTGFTRGTDSFAPSFVISDVGGQFQFSYGPPSQGPEESMIENPAAGTPWTPFYPVIPTSYTMFLTIQDIYGIWNCQAPLNVATTTYPGGNVLAAALEAHYPLSSISSPTSITTTTWINPSPQSYVPTTGKIVPDGWGCISVNDDGSGGAATGTNPPPGGDQPPLDPNNPVLSPTVPGQIGPTPSLPTLNHSGAPSDNFNLSIWSLQLPTGSPGSPDTISNTQLQAGYQSPYFFTNSADGALGMKDPGTNCVTTPHSLHCRTELREVNTNGSPASWRADGTNKLAATLIVENAGGNVCIGQIHLDDSVSTKPLVELFYDSNGNITTGVEQTTAGGNEVITYIGNVPVGTPFSYELNYSDNQLSVSINGGTPVPLSIYSLAGLPVYFKAGSYGQTSAASDVHFFALNVTHIPKLNGSAPPSSNFDLSVWELQLPTGTAGHPDTISNSQLEGGYQSPYFFTNSADGALGMKDPGTNCVTTPNATHCRTELREVNKDGTPAYWLANGVNTLQASLVVEDPGGSVNIGQIHLAEYISSKPLCQLFYDSNGNIDMGVEQTLAGGNEVRTHIGNVPVGTPFTYQISYSNNQLSVSLNGGTPVQLTTYAVGHFPVYFKAGAYGQTSSPSDLHFFGLRIYHKDHTINKSGHPSDNFNLRYWELQLPTGSAGSPDTISRNQLESGYESSYFFTNSPDGSMGMKDPGTGCVTTPHSTHCRTELREVNTDGSLASWRPDGTNILHESLVVDDAGGSVNIGQIHLDESVSTKPLAQVFYDSSGNIEVGVEQTTAGGNEVRTFIGNVPLKTPFSYALNYNDGQLSISLNGGNPVVLPTYSLGGLPVYFKAGAYGQTTSPVDLHIFDLRITHK